MGRRPRRQNPRLSLGVQPPSISRAAAQGPVQRSRPVTNGQARRIAPDSTSTPHEIADAGDLELVVSVLVYYERCTETDPLNRRKDDFDRILVHASCIECEREIPEAPKNVYGGVESGQQSVLLSAVKPALKMLRFREFLDLRYSNNPHKH